MVHAGIHNVIVSDVPLMATFFRDLSTCKISRTAIAMSAPFFILGISGEESTNASYLGIGLLILFAFSSKDKKAKKEKSD